MRDVPEHCESILNPIASSKLKIFDNHLKNIRTCLSEVSQITKSIKTSKLESKRKCGTSSNSPLSKPEYDSVQSVESKYKRQNKDESSNNEKNLSQKNFDDNNTLKVHGTGAGRRKSGSKQTSASSVHYLDLTRAPSIEVKLQHPFTSIKTDVSSSEMYSDDRSSTESVRRSINLSHSKLQNHKTSDVKVITGPCDEYLVLKICLIVKVSDYHYQILVDSVWVFSYIFIFIFK